MDSKAAQTKHRKPSSILDKTRFHCSADDHVVIANEPELVKSDSVTWKHHTHACDATSLLEDSIPSLMNAKQSRIVILHSMVKDQGKRGYH